MTPEEQRIAIAEAVGTARPYYMDGVRYIDSPNYPSDLNAMHEAERVLDADQCSTFVRLLDKYDDHACLFWECERVNPDRDEIAYEAFKLVHATAAQRAEAFLRTLNLWKE